MVLKVDPGPMRTPGSTVQFSMSVELALAIQTGPPISLVLRFSLKYIRKVPSGMVTTAASPMNAPAGKFRALVEIRTPDSTVKFKPSELKALKMPHLVPQLTGGVSKNIRH